MLEWFSSVALDGGSTDRKDMGDCGGPKRVLLQAVTVHVERG